MDDTSVDDHRGELGVEGARAGEVEELEFRDIKAARVFPGPAGGVLSLCVKEVVGFGHGRSTGEEGGIVYETGLFVMLAGFGEAEEIGGVEEI